MPTTTGQGLRDSPGPLPPATLAVLNAIPGNLISPPKPPPPLRDSKSESAEKREAKRKIAEAERKAQKRALEDAKREIIGAKLKIQDEVLRLRAIVDPETGKNYSQRRVMELLKIKSRGMVQRMEDPDWTPVRGPPRLMPREVYDVLGSKIKDTLDSDNVTISSRALKKLATDAVQAQHIARGTEPPALTKSSFGKRFRAQLEVDFNLTLRGVSPVERARFNACEWDTVYQGLMGVKKAFCRIGPPTNLEPAPKGWIWLHQWYGMDEMSVGESGEGVGAPKSMSSRETNGQPTDRSCRHVTAAFTICGNGTVVNNTFIVAGAATLVDASAPPPRVLRISDIVTNLNGSMESNKDGKGAMMVWTENFLAKVNTGGQDDQERRAVLALDGAAVHMSADVLLALGEGGFTVIKMPANTTSVTQVSDSHHINGALKKELAKMYQDDPDVAQRPHLHLYDVEAKIMAVCSKQNIHAALRERGYSISSCGRFVGVVDEDVVKHLEGLLRKGKIWRRSDPGVDAHQLRLDERVSIRELANAGVLPVDSSAIISDAALNVAIESLNRLGRKTAHHSKRRRMINVGAFSQPGANTGSVIVNDAGQLAAFLTDKAQAVVDAAEEKSKASIKQEKVETKAALAEEEKARWEKL